MLSYPCIHSKKPSHASETCYKVVGYPDSLNLMRQEDVAETITRVAYKTPLVVGLHAPTRPIPHQLQVAYSAGISSSSTQHQLFTADQWKASVSLLGTAKVPDHRWNGKFSTNLWIIDTGATHHVTDEKSWLFGISNIYVCPISLPNGKTENVMLASSVRLSENIILKNVLNIPQLVATCSPFHN